MYLKAEKERNTMVPTEKLSHFIEERDMHFSE